MHELEGAAASSDIQRATRIWSEMAIEKLTAACPALIGGSADLTGSNNTKAKAQTVVKPGDFSGSYIHYGVREHAMAAAMNGMALHGGLIPYGGTFMAFTDYCRPAIRLSALMGQRVVYVMTHDSIGLGEDGRRISRSSIWQPFGPSRTSMCFVRPTASRQPSAGRWLGHPARHRRSWPSPARMCRTCAPASPTITSWPRVGTSSSRHRLESANVTLLATGSEVGLAAAAADQLAKDGIGAVVVSLPSFELFRAQPETYRLEVLGTAPRVAVEAGVEQGWREWLRGSDRFIGMSGFGASAPAQQLYEHFGITTSKIVEAAQALAKG